MTWESLYTNTETCLVPPIADFEIQQMLETMSPVKSVGTNRYRKIVDVGDARNVSYIWDAKLDGPTMMFDPMNTIKIITFHEWSYYGFFKPSLAETLACIRKSVVSWEHIRYFCIDSENMGPEHIIGNYHWAYCYLFGEPFECK